tara:strand:- start:1224 stop:1541 length:318 start_codon:yes stop_codon:yes gene_type:complete
MPKAPPGYFTILDFMTMSELERNMALSQYNNMIRSGAAFVMDPAEAVIQVKKKARRKKSKYSKELSKELKSVRAKATTKAGKLRKGMTPAKILKQAHRNVKRKLK